jgi:hypothetical protein
MAKTGWYFGLGKSLWIFNDEHSSSLHPMSKAKKEQSLYFLGTGYNFV